MYTEPNAQCAALPSSNTAARVWDGDVAAIPAIFRDLAFRSLLIGTGMFLAGERDHVLRNAIGGSLAIEIFVLGWIGYDRHYARMQAEASRT